MTNGNDYITPIILGESLPNGEQNNRLTKRELFAAMAMQGLLANTVLFQSAKSNDLTTDDLMDMISLDATHAADALISQLNQETKEL